MDFLLIHNIIFIITEIAVIFCGFWVYLSNKKSKANLFFLLMSVAVFWWLFFYFNLTISSEGPLTILWPKLGYFSVACFFVFLYLFFVNLLKIKSKSLDKLVVGWWVFSAFISIFSNLMVKGVIFENNEFKDLILGRGAIIYYGSAFLTFSLILFFLFKKYRNNSYSEKLKYQYFIVGVSIWVLMNIIFNVGATLYMGGIKYAALGSYSIIFFLLFTAYAIVRHELMGIKTLLTQVLIVVMSGILLVDIFLLSDNLTMQLLKIGILLTFLYFSRELVKSVKKENEAKKELEKTNKILEEKNEDLNALLDISSVAASSLETQNVTQKIVDSIPDKLGHLGYLGGFLVMYDAKTTCVRADSITESELVRKSIEFFLTKPLKDYHVFANKDESFIIDAIKTGKIQKGGDLDKFVCPPAEKEIVKKIQKSAGIKSCIALPIFIRGQVIGALMFFAKKVSKEVDERDMGLMKAFVSHIGISIDNAMLFDETVKQLKKLERTKAKLEQTLQMKGEFVHVVSHQLRTPLTVVRGLISMWYDGDFEKMPPERQKDFRERIKSSVERLNSITNQMLKAMEFEGSITLQSEEVDLIKTVKDVMALLRPNFEAKGLYLNFDNRTGKDALFIDADPNYLSHVFNNMIDNAEKYTFKGGVTVSVGNRGNYICTKIQDTGVGISKENKARLFKKFSRGVNALKDNPNGSGLGLFIAKQIVNEHKGKIVFESEGTGKGTIFTITLPIKKNFGG